jgi:large subunit ribosomal protein L11
MGVPIGQVISEINKKTEAFKGMQVPIKVVIDTATKAFEVSVGTPPASALIKKEGGIEKGSGRQRTDHVADLAIEQIIKIAKMKEDDLHGKTLKSRVKEVIGTCNSMGVMVEGKHAHDSLKDVDAGTYDKEIASEKTELSAEEKKKLEEERKAMQEELKKKYADLTAKANAILDAAKKMNKDTNAIRAELATAGIPDDMIDKLAPKAKAAAPDAKPAPAKK